MEGYKQITEIKTLHRMLLHIAEIFHEICVWHKIPYYMLGGTQLGAVRHKGFIPWDDDMDFGVPRVYFRQLVLSLESELPPYIRVLTMNNAPICSDAIKLEITDSRLEYKGKTAFGVFIDIFPLDYTNTNTSLFSLNNLIHWVIKINIYTYQLPYAESISGIRSVISKTLRLLNPIKKTVIPHWLERISMRHKDNFSAYANHFGAWGLREVVDKRIFGTPRLYEFETTKLYGVEQANAYLSKLYGAYMQIPPEDKRHVHCQSIWVKPYILDKIAARQRK